MWLCLWLWLWWWQFQWQEQRWPSGESVLNVPRRMRLHVIECNENQPCQLGNIFTILSVRRARRRAPHTVMKIPSFLRSARAPFAIAPLLRPVFVITTINIVINTTAVIVATLFTFLHTAGPQISTALIIIISCRFTTVARTAIKTTTTRITNARGGGGDGSG